MAKVDYSVIFFIFILLGILFYGALVYQDSKMSHIDLMQSGSGSHESSSSSSSSDEENASENDSSATTVPPTKSSGYTSQQTASPSELLPNDANSQWASLNPMSQTQMPDLLQAGYHIGLDTIGQSLKNSNLQLRSDPVIPQMETGPWNKSTIEPDTTRGGLDFSGI